MSVKIHIHPEQKQAVEHLVNELIRDKVASGITAQVATLWGPEATEEASIRLGWTQLFPTSRDLIEPINQLKKTLHANGVTDILLCGMGGSSLAPEVIAQTAHAPLTILDSTDPHHIERILMRDLTQSAVVISSKSGSTVETDSHFRLFRQKFAEAGIAPTDRIIIVTDPGSPLDIASQEAGFRVFHADPNVGGRYSALTAFGLVPSGLAGVDIAELLDEAEAASLEAAVDNATNPALILGVILSGLTTNTNKIGITHEGTHIFGFADWAEQLIAESTGKQGKGILPVVLDALSYEAQNLPNDMSLIRLVQDASEHQILHSAGHPHEFCVSGSLGGQFLIWQYATAIASYLLKLNPFDQPDVEAAKVAARSLLEQSPVEQASSKQQTGIEILSSNPDDSPSLPQALKDFLEKLTPESYLCIQSYGDRVEYENLGGVRDLFSAHTKRPTTFGWGPRFLHSTGQFHKGGTPQGLFVQILIPHTADIPVPGRDFTFGQLIQAQAEGDANVLRQKDFPVLTLVLHTPEDDIVTLFETLNTL